MKGYKGMKSDMTCRGKKYEIGKTYTEENVKLCIRGIHWCKNLKNVFDFYDADGSNRFFEVDADEVETDGYKSVASTLTVIRELSEIEINRIVYGNGYGDGDGNGDGNVYGYVYGYGYGYGDGDGDGDGDGNGYGNVYGYVYGYGDGNGYGNGNGNGNIFKVLIFS